MHVQLPSGARDLHFGLNLPLFPCFVYQYASSKVFGKILVEVRLNLCCQEVRSVTKSDVQAHLS